LERDPSSVADLETLGTLLTDDQRTE
jgi:hypothetical protein